METHGGRTHSDVRERTKRPRGKIGRQVDEGVRKPKDVRPGGQGSATKTRLCALGPVHTPSSRRGKLSHHTKVRKGKN